jgi:hypothetical protein
VLVVMLFNRRKVLVGEIDHWITPEGQKVPFAEVFRVDKRKWDRQGLAYAWYQSAGGRPRKAVIDDLKYDGAEKILRRLLENFRGELIEKVPEDEAADDAKEV